MGNRVHKKCAVGIMLMYMVICVWNYSAYHHYSNILLFVWPHKVSIDCNKFCSQCCPCVTSTVTVNKLSLSGDD